eukprot:CAMPEP_0114493596 /NCGR_PEP_ID=MMETSP0109-20121206/4193_1 /TAXON_ID=29199 /ORGANISM="Chlorarachnion reptans, Strain CCCM449" /LENGTH=38 /DNA_ID= /DNA_START= /DNA_END= /DNA_ORIENTATION=
MTTRLMYDRTVKGNKLEDVHNVNNPFTSIAEEIDQMKS